MKYVPSIGKALLKPAGNVFRRSVSEKQDGRKSICEQSYYHWQRKFSKQAYGLIKESTAVPAVPEKPDIAFVEVPYIQLTAENAGETASGVAVIRTSSVRIEITNDISDWVLLGY